MHVSYTPCFTSDDTWPSRINVVSEKGEVKDYYPENRFDSRTCHDTGESRWFSCSECGFGFGDIYIDDEDRYDAEHQPNFCPNCGAKVKVGER